MEISQETIYQSIYVYPRGGLKRELQACLRSGRAVRRRRGRREMRGRIIDAVPIGQRPPEVEGRLIPGHHEGDLVMGSKASNSAVGTIVERTTGYLTLLPLPGGHDAASVADAIIAATSSPSPSASPPPASRSTSPTPTPPGRAAATRTSPACSASTSPRAPPSATTPPPGSRPSPASSTTAPASASATTPRAKPSLSSSPTTCNALRRPPENAAEDRPDSDCRPRS